MNERKKLTIGFWVPLEGINWQVLSHVIRVIDESVETGIVFAGYNYSVAADQRCLSRSGHQIHTAHSRGETPASPWRRRLRNSGHEET